MRVAGDSCSERGLVKAPSEWGASGGASWGRAALVKIQHVQRPCRGSVPRGFQEEQGGHVAGTE